MFKTVEDLQSFIVWASQQKIQRVKIDKVEIEFSALAFLDEKTVSELSDSASPIVDTEPLDRKEEDELLYWSSNS